MNLSVSLTDAQKKWGLGYLIFELFVLPYALGLVGLLLPKPLSPDMRNILFFVINFTVLLIIFRTFLLKNLKIAIHNPWRLLRYAGAGWVVYELCSYGLGWLLPRIRPDFFNVNDQAILGMAQDPFSLFSLCTVFLVPMAEELLFRGVLFCGFRNRGRLFAYSLSTVVFALIHVMGFVGSFDLGLLALCFLQYLPAGLCLGWAYEKSDTIFAPILMHMTINQLGLMILR